MDMAGSRQSYSFELHQYLPVYMSLESIFTLTRALLQIVPSVCGSGDGSGGLGVVQGDKIHAGSVCCYFSPICDVPVHS